VLIQRRAVAPAAGATTFTLTWAALTGVITGTLDVVAALGDGTVQCDGDPGFLGTLVGLVDRVTPISPSSRPDQAYRRALCPRTSPA
jgi:hypothetical protein